MSYIATTLLPGEEILCKAHVSWAAHVFALVLFLGLMVTGQMSGLMTTELALTNKRLIGKRGLFLRRNIVVAHAEITVVRVARGLMGGLFNYGSLVILTRDGKKIMFKGISEPDYIKMQIEEAVEISVLGHTISEYVAEKF